MTPQPHSALAFGAPQFADPAVSELARQQGDLAAWQLALGTQDPAAALQRVHGDFAVGIVGAGGQVLLAVDRFAVRTMCYRLVAGELIFAERADALAHAPLGDSPLLARIPNAATERAAPCAELLLEGYLDLSERLDSQDDRDRAQAAAAQLLQCLSAIRDAEATEPR